MARVLIVEDEPRISSFVAKGLAADGFATTVAADGHTGLDYALTGDFDLVILDIGLPGLGLDVDGGVDARLGFDFNLSFGLSQNDGFFFVTNTPGPGGTQIPELKVMSVGELLPSVHE